MATKILTSLFLAAFLFSAVSEVSAVARRSTRDLNLTFEMGRDAFLTCTVRNIGKKRVIWRKLSDPVPLTVGTTNFWPGNKYRVKRVGDDWRLAIKNIQYEDAGEYECRLSGNEDVANILSLIIPGGGRTHFQPTDTMVWSELGGTATLPCHVKNILKHFVLWLNNDDQVVSLRKMVYSSEHKRFKVLHTTREEWSLEVADVRAEDYGVYKCVINTSPFLTRTVTLTEGKNRKKTLEPGKSVGGGNPRLVMNTFRGEVEVYQYESLTLTCQFTGDPLPTIRWERHIWNRDGTKVVEDLLTDTETYTLLDAQPEHTGIYYCKATNGVPPPEQGKIRVRVTEVITTTTPVPTTTPFNPMENAVPRVYPKTRTVFQALGSDAHMECRGIGVPIPEVQWRLNGLLVDQNFKHSVVNYHIRHHTTDSHLFISSVGVSNEGVYSCTAVNRLGEESSTVELVVLK